MIQLSENQKNRVEQYAKKYLDLPTEELNKIKKEREEKSEKYKDLLKPSNLSHLTQDTVSRVVKGLWATQFWQNKDYKTNQIIDSNGLDKLGIEFTQLLYGDNSVSERFDQFKNRVKHLGPSSITEIMCLVSPKEYCIWNDKPKNILPFLKMKTLLPERVYKYQIRGEEYEECIRVLDLVRKQLDLVGLKNPDFLDVDYFLYFIFENYFEEIPKQAGEGRGKQKQAVVEEKWNTNEISHWDAIGLITKLGNLLGYNTYVADPSKKFEDGTLGDIATLKEVPGFTQLEYIDTIKNIDAIWFKEEFPRYCFEVEHTTSITKGLLRIYQARNFKVKSFIVAPEANRSKFKKEINKAPFKSIKGEYKFRNYKQLIAFYTQAKKYHEQKSIFLR